MIIIINGESINVCDLKEFQKLVGTDEHDTLFYAQAREEKLCCVCLSKCEEEGHKTKMGDYVCSPECLGG